VDIDTISTDMNFILLGINNIKKEIILLESMNNENLKPYLTNLIDFAGDAIDEIEYIGNLFEEVKKKYGEILEKFGEKKGIKPKDIFEPIYNFLKYFLN
jgi:hypothetical protein